MQIIINVIFSIASTQETIFVLKYPDYFVPVRTKMFDTLDIDT